MHRVFGKFRRFRLYLGATFTAATLVLWLCYPFLLPEKAESQGYGGQYRSGERLAIIEMAQYYRGASYYALDCSEFTRLVYGNAIGVWMPSDYFAQRSYGRPVYSNLKRGDLLMYADGSAIYWGNGMVLMSSHYYGYVEKIPMNDLYGYIGARRIR
jgi:cell wall-associated NlpC family hydrolase